MDKTITTFNIMLNYIITIYAGITRNTIYLIIEQKVIILISDFVIGKITLNKMHHRWQCCILKKIYFIKVFITEFLPCGIVRPIFLIHIWKISNIYQSKSVAWILRRDTTHTLSLNRTLYTGKIINLVTVVNDGSFQQQALLRFG